MPPLTLRERIGGPILRSVRHVWPSDRFLWPASRFLLAPLPPEMAKGVIASVDGLRLRLSPKEYPDGSMYFGVYEIATVRLLRRLLRAGDAVIDVGGNIGYMTLQMARLVLPGGRVHAFEPVPDSADRLAENVGLNDMESIVTLHRAAVGATVGEAHIFTFADDNSPRHALASMKPLHGRHEQLATPVVSLDAVVQEPIRLIKIDVEGAEVDVLRGATRIIANHRPHIIVENNPGTLAAFGNTFADVVKVVSEAAPRGYEVASLAGMRLCKLAIRDGGGRLPIGNVWLRPRSFPR